MNVYWGHGEYEWPLAVKLKFKCTEDDTTLLVLCD